MGNPDRVGRRTAAAGDSVILAFALGLALGSVLTGLALGLARAARFRDDLEAETYDQLRPPAWVTESSAAMVAVPHAIEYDEGILVTKFEDEDHDATVYRFRARSGL